MRLCGCAGSSGTMLVANALGIFIYVLITAISLIRNSFESTDVFQNDSPTLHDISNEVYIKELKNERRVARSADDLRESCNNWAPWVNDNHPSTTHKEDREYISTEVMRGVCPYGNISKFQCRDDKGEPFQQNITAPEKTFFISCYDINVGVICTVLDPSLKHCPDMSIRYYCSCPVSPTTIRGLASSAAWINASAKVLTTKPPNVSNITSTTTKSSPGRQTTSSSIKTRFVNGSFVSSHLNPALLYPSTTSKVLTTTSKSTFVSSRLTSARATLKKFFYPKRETTEATRVIKSLDAEGSTIVSFTHSMEDRATRNDETVITVGKLSIPRWILLLIGIGSVFIFNTCLSLCLYKKANDNLRKKRNKKVHPLQFV